MARVAAGGADALLGAFVSSPRFDRVLEGLTVTRVSSGAVECELVGGEAHSNQQQ